MKNILLLLCGYRRYSFTLMNGRQVTFRTKTYRQAIQKALNLEKRIRKNRERTIRTLLHTHSNRYIPSELLQNILGKNPDRPASIAG